MSNNFHESINWYVVNCFNGLIHDTAHKVDVRLNTWLYIACIKSMYMCSSPLPHIPAIDLLPLPPLPRKRKFPWSHFACGRQKSNRHSLSSLLECQRLVAFSTVLTIIRRIRACTSIVFRPIKFAGSSGSMLLVESILMVPRGSLQQETEFASFISRTGRRAMIRHIQHTSHHSACLVRDREL